MKLDVLAIGAHPDDVELGCGGTVALLARAGKRVGILHLTRGEMGTRGTPAERIAEAEAAAQALGAAELGFLDCGDGGLRTGPAEEDALIVAELAVVGTGAAVADGHVTFGNIWTSRRAAPPGRFCCAYSTGRPWAPTIPSSS